MSTPKRILCNHAAYDAVCRLLPEIDSLDGLVGITTVIAAHAGGDVEAMIDLVDSQIQKLVDRVRVRTGSGNPSAILAHVNSLMFDTFGWKLSDDVDKSVVPHLLPEVVTHRQGSASALCIVYKAVIERLGVRSAGVSVPGYFLLDVDYRGCSFVDPGAEGTLVDEDGLQAIIRERMGDGFTIDPSTVIPADHRQWITRITQNLLHIYCAGSAYQCAAGVLEIERLLWPEQDCLLRDLALVYARLGIPGPAAGLLADYIRKHPEDPQHQGLVELHASLTM